MKNGRHINVALFVPHAGCPHTCSFCNQRTISGSAGRLTADDVRKAAETALRTGGKGGEIAFFGGSFTAIEREYMTELLEAAFPFVFDGSFSGIRISTRPDCINGEILGILKKYGVASIELGAQSMDDRVLILNERGHSAEDVRAASAMIRAYGFGLGLQMMTGLYGDSGKETAHTVEEFIRIRPDTVRIYPTVTLEGTALAELYRKGEYIPQTLDEAVEECAEILKRFNEENIRVIRLGLHSGGNVGEGYIAGAYHPAFRELCESRIYRGMIGEYIEKNGLSGDVEYAVPPEDLSKAIGQKKSNILYFAEKGIRLSVVPQK